MYYTIFWVAATATAATQCLSSTALALWFPGVSPAYPSSSVVLDIASIGYGHLWVQAIASTAAITKQRCSSWWKMQSRFPLLAAMGKRKKTCTFTALAQKVRTHREDLLLIGAIKQAVNAQIWLDMHKYDQIWSDMHRYGQICTDMVRYAQIWPYMHGYG